jgi:mono/diheme cytochrome c family protein
MNSTQQTQSNDWLKLTQRVLAILGAIVLVLALTIIALVGPFPWNNYSASFSDIDRHFKYGSIGGESTNGLPYWLWQVLPDIFPEKLPGKGYESLGFIHEPGEELPVGFAKSKFGGLEVITQNCATCHTGTVRTSDQSKPQTIATMPAMGLDLQGYIKFLGEVALDSRFNAREIMPYIEAAGAKLNPVEKLLYRFYAIPEARTVLINQKKKFAFMERQTFYGPGRVDTFTPYKGLRFNIPSERLDEDELFGIADFPPIWAQGVRNNMKLHWDGNNESIDERNKSAALALVQPTTINLSSVHRVKDWLLKLPHPSYPYPINEELATQGKVLYQNTCASCHAFGGAKVGTVEPIEKIGTDRGRLDSYTYELASNQYTLFADIFYQGKDQRFTHFRKTNGYANLPLDGVWLRAPYLHNGSVPTLRDLLENPENRPQKFYRGNDIYDGQKVGFVSNVADENGKKYFKYDTSLRGNSNEGHVYGTDLTNAEKEALVEYLKKL